MKEIDQEKYQIKQIFFIVLYLSFFTISGCAGSNPPSVEWNLSEASHRVDSKTSIRVLLSISDVYIADWVALGMDIANKKIYILGALDINDDFKLVALDINTGKSIWNSESRYMSRVYATDDGVYVDEAGIGGSIKKYNPVTGEEIWYRQFWDSGGVSHIIMYDEKMHVYLSPDKHKVLRPSDGKTIFPISAPPFFDSGICGIAYQTPIYTTNTIFYKSNRTSSRGEICAVDILTGKLKWKSDLDIISNIVADNNIVFVIVEDGYILALEPSSGEEIFDLRISFDKSFILDNDDTQPNRYFLAYDTRNNILVAYLGDSLQVFAFEIPKK